MCPCFGPDEGVGDSDREAGEGAHGRVTQHEDGSAGGGFAPAPAAAPAQAEREGECCVSTESHAVITLTEKKNVTADTCEHTQMAFS